MAVMGGHQVGVIVPDGRVDRRFLPEVVEASALLIEMGRLRSEVTAALRDVEAEPEPLVRAGYEERRRLELDLHDGAQQRLVSLGMALRLAQRHLGDGTVDVDQVLDGAVAEIGTAVVELRQIAHGLRPSSLDDGLAAALENLSRNTPCRWAGPAGRRPARRRQHHGVLRRLGGGGQRGQARRGRVDRDVGASLRRCRAGERARRRVRGRRRAAGFRVGGPA